MPIQNEAIANCRVSSDEQLKNNSLNRQNDEVNRLAEALGVKLVKTWSGSVSSKKGSNLARKDLQEMLEFCRKHKSVKYAIFDEPDRFMRSIEEMLYFIVEFKQLGVDVKFAAKPELSTKDAKDTLLLVLEAFKAEGSNEERIGKAVNGHAKAIREGRFTFAVKPGYIKGHSLPGVHDPDPVTWKHYKRALTRIATSLSSVKEAMDEFNTTCPAVLNGKIKPYRMDNWTSRVVDPYYAGVLEIDKKVKVRNERGLHTPMITIAQHEKIVDIVAGRKKRPAPRKNGNPKYPMNKVVVCDTCVGKGNIFKFTGSNHTNGKTKKLYEDYRCRGCGRVIKRDALHGRIERLFGGVDLSEKGRTEVLGALNAIWKDEEADMASRKQDLLAHLQIVEEAKSAQLDLLSDPSLISLRADITLKINDKKQEIKAIESQVARIENKIGNDKAHFMKFALEFIDNLAKNYLKLSLKNIEVCKQAVFPAGFWVSDELKVYTPQISPIYRVRSQQKRFSEAENPSWWVARGSNPRPPRCKRGALAN